MEGGSQAEDGRECTADSGVDRSEVAELGAVVAAADKAEEAEDASNANVSGDQDTDDVQGERDTVVDFAESWCTQSFKCPPAAPPALAAALHCLELLERRAAEAEGRAQRSAAEHRLAQRALELAAKRAADLENEVRALREGCPSAEELQCRAAALRRARGDRKALAGEVQRLHKWVEKRRQAEEARTEAEAAARSQLAARRSVAEQVTGLLGQSQWQTLSWRERLAACDAAAQPLQAQAAAEEQCAELGAALRRMEREREEQGVLREDLAQAAASRELERARRELEQAQGLAELRLVQLEQAQQAVGRQQRRAELAERRAEQREADAEPLPSWEELGIAQREAHRWRRLAARSGAAMSRGLLQLGAAAAAPGRGWLPHLLLMEAEAPSVSPDDSLGGDCAPEAGADPRGVRRALDAERARSAAYLAELRRLRARHAALCEGRELPPDGGGGESPHHPDQAEALREAEQARADRDAAQARAEEAEQRAAQLQDLLGSEAGSERERRMAEALRRSAADRRAASDALSETRERALQAFDAIRKRRDRERERAEDLSQQLGDERLERQGLVAELELLRKTLRVGMQAVDCAAQTGDDWRSAAELEAARRAVEAEERSQRQLIGIEAGAAAPCPPPPGFTDGNFPEWAYEPGSVSLAELALRDDEDGDDKGPRRTTVTLRMGPDCCLDCVEYTTTVADTGPNAVLTDRHSVGDVLDRFAQLHKRRFGVDLCARSLALRVTQADCEAMREWRQGSLEECSSTLWSPRWERGRRKKRSLCDSKHAADGFPSEYPHSNRPLRSLALVACDFDVFDFEDEIRLWFTVRKAEHPLYLHPEVDRPERPLQLSLQAFVLGKKGSDAAAMAEDSDGEQAPPGSPMAVPGSPSNIRGVLVASKLARHFAEKRRQKQGEGDMRSASPNNPYAGAPGSPRGGPRGTQRRKSLAPGRAQSARRQSMFPEDARRRRAGSPARVRSPGHASPGTRVASPGPRPIGDYRLPSRNLDGRDGTRSASREASWSSPARMRPQRSMRRMDAE
eukprot:TRINITY_DN23793_c0_g1_i1.p1 TRINITY_DN23793_c0_g1~~TRINITY_DN23793_c0_g1_i1.p1  ORF type:complete len:1029 (+),score=275.83 TRINITY_DN23793_c0_g1_i1:98-3184(+)